MTRLIFGLIRYFHKTEMYCDVLQGNGFVNTLPRTRNNGICVLCGPCYNWLLGYTTILTTEEGVFYVVRAVPRSHLSISLSSSLVLHSLRVRD
jgi:hypothetical protein